MTVCCNRMNEPGAVGAEARAHQRDDAAKDFGAVRRIREGIEDFVQDPVVASSGKGRRGVSDT
jgi:hypothetical protein